MVHGPKGKDIFEFFRFWILLISGDKFAHVRQQVMHAIGLLALLGCCQPLQGCKVWPVGN